MNSVILIGSQELSLSNLEKIDFISCISVNRMDSRLVLEFIDGRAYFDYIEDFSNEYGMDEIKRIPISNPRFISLAYSSKAILKQVLVQINKFKNVVIDDDMGNIIPYNDYIAQLD